jgi:hypothetical protein
MCGSVVEGVQTPTDHVESTERPVELVLHSFGVVDVLLFSVLTNRRLLYSGGSLERLDLLLKHAADRSSAAHVVSFVAAMASD